MKKIVITAIGLIISFGVRAECLLQISGRNSVKLRTVPESSGSVIRDLPPKTIVQVIKSQTVGRDNWLQINQPSIGWIPLKSITTFCGETNQAQIDNVNSLKVRGMAGDTRAVERLAYFLYKGAEEELKDVTIEALEGVVLANPIALINVLDNQVEVVRQSVLKGLKKSSKAKQKLEETLQRYNPNTPTVKTWQSIS